MSHVLLAFDSFSLSSYQCHLITSQLNDTGFALVPNPLVNFLDKKADTRQCKFNFTSHPQSHYRHVPQIFIKCERRLLISQATNEIKVAVKSFHTPFFPVNSNYFPSVTHKPHTPTSAQSHHHAALHFKQHLWVVSSYITMITLGLVWLS